MYEFWYNVRPKYDEKAKLCCMDTSSFIVYIKTWYLQRYCRRCWNYIWYFKLWIRLLPKGKNKKIIGLIKDEIGWKTMTKFVGQRAKTYS